MSPRTHQKLSGVTWWRLEAGEVVGFHHCFLEVKMVHLNFFDEKKMLGVGSTFFQKSMGSPHWILGCRDVETKKIDPFWS